MLTMLRVEQMGSQDFQILLQSLCVGEHLLDHAEDVVDKPVDGQPRGHIQREPACTEKSAGT